MEWESESENPDSEGCDAGVAGATVAFSSSSGMSDTFRKRNAQPFDKYWCVIVDDTTNAKIYAEHPVDENTFVRMMDARTHVELFVGFLGGFKGLGTRSRYQKVRDEEGVKSGLEYLKELEEEEEEDEEEENFEEDVDVEVEGGVCEGEGGGRGGEHKDKEQEMGGGGGGGGGGKSGRENDEEKGDNNMEDGLGNDEVEKKKKMKKKTTTTTKKKRVGFNKIEGASTLSAEELSRIAEAYEKHGFHVYHLKSYTVEGGREAYEALMKARMYAMLSLDERAVVLEREKEEAAEAEFGGDEKRFVLRTKNQAAFLPGMEACY
jgi:hypothetical protein